MSEPTSTLTFQDLIIELARKIGIAYYGEDGDDIASVPIDKHDLNECKRHVNNAIRMFLADAPKPNGWRFSRPIASVTVWGTIDTDDDNPVVSLGYNQTTNKTTLQSTDDSFYATMELKSIVLTGVGTYTITNYVDATTIKVEGDASAAGTAGVTWSITADGNYTLPSDFAGEYIGAIHFAASTNTGTHLTWSDDSTIRSWRADVTSETGDPFLAAIRPKSTGTPHRRWELMLYPHPDEVVILEFPYTLYFDKLVDLDDVVPSIPFAHDDTLKAACLAIVERDVEEVLGVNWDYYTNQALPNSYRIDSMSAPKRLGYFGNPSPVSGSQAISTFRNTFYQRPTVTFNT